VTAAPEFYQFRRSVASRSLTYFYQRIRELKEERVKLTKGERVFLQRRRYRLTQEHAARRMSMSHDTLSKIEKGKPVADGYGTSPLSFVARGLRPTKGEMITILRKRLGITLDGLADRLNVSRVTIFNREHDIDGAKMPQDLMLEYLNSWAKRRKVA
jgi:transcriptional regulator with XRE-family HTH domain